MENLHEHKNENENKSAFSDKYIGLRDALNTLYIKGNISGRNKFRQKWPEIAHYLFGNELIAHDNDGGLESDRLRVLESEAETKLLPLKTILNQMEEKSVDYGVLQFNYIEKVLNSIEPFIAPYLYKDYIIEKVRPDFIKKPEIIKEQQTLLKADPLQENRLLPEEREILKNSPLEIMIPQIIIQKPQKNVLLNTFNLCSKP